MSPLGSYRADSDFIATLLLPHGSCRHQKRRMRVFVSEFVCGGGWPEKEIPASLCREGRAMLLSVLVDMLRLPEVHVVTTWDERLGPFPLPAMHQWRSRLTVHSVNGARHEQELFSTLSQQVDRVLVIAPELDDILTDRIEFLQQREIATCNCSVEATKLCSDKFALYEWLSMRGIPTIPTRMLKDGPGDWTGPLVLKRRDGAGSTGTQRVRSLDEIPFIEAAQQADWILQPEIPGRALSMAVIFDHNTPSVHLPVSEQHLGDEGRFQYLGGFMPARDVPIEVIHQIVDSVAADLDGLQGYVGVDLLVPADQTEAVLLVEINPRLTTSYLGARSLCTSSLARWLLDPSHSAAPRFVGEVHFRPDDEIVFEQELSCR